MTGNETVEDEQVLAKVGERYKLPLEFLEKFLQIVRSYPPSEQLSRVKKLISETKVN
jgi:hypothetical protein